MSRGKYGRFSGRSCRINRTRYICNARDFNYYPAMILKYNASIEFKFLVPPKFIKKPEDKIASESQDLEFECEIYGKPEPKITWLKNGERITLSAYWQIVNGCVFRRFYVVKERIL